MSNPIRQLCTILLEKAQSRSTEDLPNVVTEVLDELDDNNELTQLLRQDSRMLQINVGQSTGYQVLVEANAIAYVGDQYHLESKVVIKALAKLLDEFAKKQPIVGTPNNLPRSGAIAFIGRDQKIKELDQQLQNSDRIAITAVKGMGGIGKTELVLQYAIASLPKTAYPGGICWLRSRDQEIATQIVSFAKANLGLFIPDDMEAPEQVTFTWQRWPEGNTLIVIDDVTDYDAIAPYLPPSDPRFKVLITTRINLGSSVKEIEIEELSDENAIALLKSIIGDERIKSQIDDAFQLCEWVGSLPLGLELLGRFLARKPDWAIAKLLKRLESKRLDAKALVEGESGMTAPLGIAAALELSWAELDEQEQDLGCLLGMFAVAPIPWHLVEQCFEDIDPDDVEEWRDGLRDRSLIKRVEEGVYQLHQIVQEFFREKLKQKGDDAIALKKAFGRVMVVQAKLLDATPTVVQIERVQGAIAHLKETVNQWLPDLDKEEMIWPFIGIGQYYVGQGDYKLAEPWYERCVHDLEKLLNSEHIDVAQSIYNLARIYKALGKYKKAEELLLEALKLVRTNHAEKYPIIASILNNIAGVYRLQGRLEEAESLYLKALELRQDILTDGHPDIAVSLNNLAELYKDKGEYKKAESRYLEALELVKKKLGENHPSVATCKNNIAGVYRLQGRLEEAESLYLKALELRQDILTDGHPDIAVSLNNLAELYKDKGEYKKAESRYLEALELAKKKLGENHLDIAAYFHNLAEVSRKKLDYKNAEIFAKKALAKRLDILGEEHPDIVVSYNTLANIYRDQNKYDKAKSRYRQAFAIIKKIHIPDHMLATHYFSYGILFQKLEEHQKSKSLYLPALDIYKKKFGDNHSNIQNLQSYLDKIPDDITPLPLEDLDI